MDQRVTQSNFGKLRYLIRLGKSPAYLTKLNAGDTAFVAKTLKQNGYYSTTEAKYAAGLKQKKADIDASLGAVE